jgi:prevent-host-death family protein
MSYIGAAVPQVPEMTETISARDANHHFSRLLREVEAGKEFVVTRNGVPVARIVPEGQPEGKRALSPAQEEALAESMAWLGRGWPLGIDKLDRDELYDDARSWMRRLE